MSKMFYPRQKLHRFSRFIAELSSYLLDERRGRNFKSRLNHDCFSRDFSGNNVLEYLASL